MENTHRQFKGWTKPGPLIESVSEVEADETLDALSGSYRIYQYADGHRFSTDDLLVAWYATSHSVRAEKVLDLGSGIGSVAMTTAWRLPNAKFTTIEAQERSVRLARKSLKHNELESRFTLITGDMRDATLLESTEKFDLITGSPPYFPLTDGVLSEHPQKVECRFEARGDVRDYCDAAARNLAPGGMFFLVFPKNQEERLLEGVLRAGLIILRSRAVVFREGEVPLLSLYQVGRLTDFPEKLSPKLFSVHSRNVGWEEPALIIRAMNGEVHPEYSVAKLSIGFPP
ncbi:MAG: methyltransferase [Cryobacterium sp.]|nr:methyltransferase [Oligoflexia bacterium]